MSSTTTVAGVPVEEGGRGDERNPLPPPSEIGTPVG